ncbi:helix-turn-helix domain-containing protein [Streptacidiphilus sp. PAMC 29251]
MEPLINVAKLREVAASMGDKTDYSIHKRTGLPKSTISRLFNGIGEPKLSTVDKLGEPYGLKRDDLWPVAA